MHFKNNEELKLTASEYIRALSTMGESGVYWVDQLFKLCVMLLVDLANWIGISYEEINIWIFVIIWPLLTVYQTMRIRLLKNKLIKMNSQKAS